MASLLVGLRFSSRQDIRGSAAAFAARTRSGRVVTWGHRQFGGRMGGSIWASCHHEIPIYSNANGTEQYIHHEIGFIFWY